MLTPEQEDFIRERVYDVWRLGKYPDQTPMWHELDVKPTFVEASDIIATINEVKDDAGRREGFDAGVRAVYAAMPNMLDILREGPTP